MKKDPEANSKLSDDKLLEQAIDGKISWSEYEQRATPKAFLEHGLSFDMRFGPPTLFAPDSPIEIELPGLLVTAKVQRSSLLEMCGGEEAMITAQIVITGIVRR